MYSEVTDAEDKNFGRIECASRLECHGSLCLLLFPASRMVNKSDS